MGWGQGMIDTESINKLRRLQQLRETADRETSGTVALSLSTYHLLYPWMAPDAKWSLAKAGVPPTSETATTAARAAAQIENTQGLGFQPIGSPVTKPSGPVDATSILNGLEQRRTQPVPTADPAALAAPSSPLRQMAGDQWDQLDPAVRSELDKLTITDDKPSNAPAEKMFYQVGGYDSLSLAARHALSEIVGKYASDQKFEGYVQSFASDPGKTFLVAAHPLELDKPALSFGGYDAGNLGAIVPIVRTTGMVLSAPFQELEGQFRNLHQFAQGLNEGEGFTNPGFLQSQSDLGVAVGDVLGGRPVDTGEGFFVNPQSGVGQERYRREIQRGVIGGHAITLGRSFAADVLMLEPDSQPSNLLSGLVDFTAAVSTDPTIWAGRGFAALRKSSALVASSTSATEGLRAWRATGEATEGLKAFQEAGGIAGLRPVISQQAANTWLDAPERLPVLEKIAAQTDARSIWVGLGRQADPAVAARLADASTPAEVAEILRGELGTTIRKTFKPNDFGRPPFAPSPGDTGALVGRAKSPSKWTAMMPWDEVDGHDLMANGQQVERIAALVGATPEDGSRWFDAMARTTTPFERQAVYEQIMKDTFSRVVGRGASSSEARVMTRLYQEQASVDRAYAIEAVANGQGGFAQQPVIAGKVMHVAEVEPQWLAQTVDGKIPMPDWRVLRRELSTLKPVLELPGVEGTEHLLNFMQTKVWKRLQIATVKTGVKIVADEQAQMAGRGFISFFNHPIQMLAIVLATPLSELPEDATFIARLQHATAGKVRWTAEHVPGVEARLTHTLVSEEEFGHVAQLQEVASHGFDTAIDSKGVLLANDWKILDYAPGVNDAEFTAAHAKHLANMSASPEMRGFARAGSLDQAKAWYWDGPGKEWRELFAKNGRTGKPELLTRAGSDAFVEKKMLQMQAVTNGNPELIEAIATGKLGGTSLFSAFRDGTPKVSKNFVTKLADYSADFPMATPQQKGIYSLAEARRQTADKGFNRLLQALLGTPSAVLSKSPLFRQVYWNDVIEKAPFMTSQAQMEALRIAEHEANVGPRLLADLKRAIGKGNQRRVPFSGVVTLEQADVMAKGRALDMVREMTDEFTNRSQMMDVLRLISPFGEVWRKTIMRWGKVIAENPASLRTGQKVFTAARGQGLGQVLGQPAGQGFFHQDLNGQEVFTIPGSEWATAALTGAPVPLVGNVQGLSLGTEIFPGLGPAASIPVAWTLEKLNAPKGISDFIFNFGPPKEWKDPVNFAPTWFQRAVGQNRPTSPDSVRTFNNSVIDYVRYGMTNGDYDLSTPAGIQHAMEDATGKAEALNWIRGAAQFFVPGAPSPEFLVRDKTGKLVDAALLVQEYHDLQNADPNTAGQVFLQKYGPDIFKAMTAKSYAYTFGIPTTREAADWVTAHPDVKRDLPHIFGYFTPQSETQDFDYETYRAQFGPGGGRAQLSPEQWAKLGNSRLAALQYGRVRDAVDEATGGKMNDQQRAILAGFKKTLIDQYPGYGDSLYGGLGLPARSEAPLLVIEARKALDNATVKNSDAGKGLSAYMKVHDAVDKSWVALGYSSGSWATAANPTAVALRQFMRTTGATVTGTHPLFGPLMENVFEREMRDDTDPAALTGGG
jgi:hypothetical protein